MASGWPKRPPRRPQRHPRGLPRGPQEANIIPNHPVVLGPRFEETAPCVSYPLHSFLLVFQFSTSILSLMQAQAQ
eukprot:2686755-Pyramimonas_sp.AAC.1